MLLLLMVEIILTTNNSSLGWDDIMREVLDKSTSLTIQFLKQPGIFLHEGQGFEAQNTSNSENI